MSAWPEPASFHDVLPKTIKFCKACQRDTPHQIRANPGVTVVICVPCLNRALLYESDRD
jgi:hypothetical protein